MAKREPGYRRPSEAHLNAIALARRSAPHADEHRRSVVAAYTSGRPRRSSTSLRSLARHVIRELAMEAPLKTTEGYDQLDAGGAPRFTAEFSAWLDSSPTRVVGHEEPADAIIRGYLRWPYRAALYLMLTNRSPKISRLGYIVTGIVSGLDPEAAAIAAGAHPDDAEHTARRALETYIARRGALKMSLPKPSDAG